MAKSVLLVSETEAGFHGKLREKTAESFRNAGWHVIEPDAEVTSRPDHVHIIRLLEPITLLNTLQQPNVVFTRPISFLIPGLSEIFRSEKKKIALQALSERPEVAKIFIMSIHPASLKAHCKQIGYLQTDKVAFIHEPPYENTEDYRKIGKNEARKALQIAPDSKLALYFGTYWYSKGPDLLLEAAKQLPDIDFAFVGDTKLGSITITPSDYAKFKNIHFVDRYVTDEETILWFRACDLVVLPYRKFYEHDTSGIFNQAMQAERPVVMPDFNPFFDLKRDTPRIGIRFVAEDIGELKARIRWYFEGKNFEWFLPHPYTYDRYLSQAGSWDEIGRLLA